MTALAGSCYHLKRVHHFDRPVHCASFCGLFYRRPGRVRDAVRDGRFYVEHQPVRRVCRNDRSILCLRHSRDHLSNDPGRLFAGHYFYLKQPEQEQRTRRSVFEWNEPGTDQHADLSNRGCNLGNEFLARRSGSPNHHTKKELRLLRRDPQPTGTLLNSKDQQDLVPFQQYSLQHQDVAAGARAGPRLDDVLLRWRLAVDSDDHRGECRAQG